MRSCLLFLLSFFLTHEGQQQERAQQDYAILIRGTIAGQESVTESRDREGNTISQSDHEIFLSEGTETKRMAFTTKMVLAKGTNFLVSYSVQFTSGEARDSYDVTVSKGGIRRVLNRGGRTSDISVPAGPDILLFDFTVYHHYDNLARKYDFKKSGRQTFSTFAPVIGSMMPITLSHLADSNLDYGKGTIPVRNFRVEFMATWTGTLSVDKGNHLVRLIVPEQDLQVLRKDLLPKP
jgi:hypothetical protein